MHASMNLLKTVLEPPISGSSSQKSLSSKESRSTGSRRASTRDSGLYKSVTKKENQVPEPVRRSCLCAPTNHPGSFRCRLHRGNQQQLGSGVAPPKPSSAAGASEKSPYPTVPLHRGKQEDGGERPLGSSGAQASSGSSVATSGKGSSRFTLLSDSENPVSKHVSFADEAPTARQPRRFVMTESRRSDARPSRLSRVSAAGDTEAPKARGGVLVSAPKVEDSTVRFLHYSRLDGGVPVLAPKVDDSTVRFHHYSSFDASASGAVLDRSFLAEKFRSGWKAGTKDAFGSATSLSRAALS